VRALTVVVEDLDGVLRNEHATIGAEGSAAYILMWLALSHDTILLESCAGYPASRRQLGQGYAFDDYEFSSDDESADPVAAADALALAAPLHRWRGPLEFWDAADEGAYIDWACGAWQVGSAARSPHPAS
jgi:hypothetical protein